MSGVHQTGGDLLLDRLRGVFGGRSEPSGPTCLVCDSTEVETLALGAYRCGMCGHEGGDGLPEYLAGRRRAEILALPEAQRQELAVRNAAAARNLLNGIDQSGASGPRPEEIALKVASHLVGMSGGLRMVAGQQDRMEEEPPSIEWDQGETRLRFSVVSGCDKCTSRCDTGRFQTRFVQCYMRRCASSTMMRHGACFTMNSMH